MCGSSSFIPLIHGVLRYGSEHMFLYSGMKWYLLELTVYGIGVSLYTVCLASSAFISREEEPDEEFL